MATPKGYSDREKHERLSAEFVTVSPIAPSKIALDVRDTGTVSVLASDAVEASSTTSVINATAHAALVGDKIRFTSGSLSRLEFDVWSVTANTITLGQTASVAPSAGNTFDILRSTALTVSSAGTISTSSAPIQFVLDGADQEVTEDTVTPANNRPLPVKLVSFTGDINVTADDLNVSISHINDSVKIGDGTDLLAINADGSLNATVSATNLDIRDLSAAQDNVKVSDGTDSLEISAAGEALVKVNSALPSGTNNIGDVDVLTQPARSHTTDSIKVGDGTDFLAISAAGAAQVEVTNSVTVSATNLDIRDLVHTQDSIRIGDGTDLLLITAAGEALVSLTTALPAGSNNIGDVDVLTQPARSHTTDSMRIGDGADLVNVTASNQLEVAVTASLPAGTNAIGKLSANSGVDIGDVTIDNGAGAGAVNIQDGGNSITVDGTVSPTYLDVVDLIDGTFGLLDASSTNINGNAGAFVQIVASTAATAKKLQILDTTGGFIGLYTGAAASEVLKLVIGPGSDQTIEASIASGTRLSVRRLDSTSALTSGFLAINILG